MNKWNVSWSIDDVSTGITPSFAAPRFFYPKGMSWVILADVSFCELVNTEISGYVQYLHMIFFAKFGVCRLPSLVDAMSTAKEWFFIVMFETWETIMDSTYWLQTGAFNH